MSGAMQHTPGPWQAYERKPADIGIAGFSFHIGNAHLQHTVAECNWGADARLISAAPDLLAACESMLKTCGGSEHWNGETHESLKLIEAAIAKAGIQ